MSLRVWAIQLGDLKGSSRAGLLFATARFALRVEPWVPPGAEGPWRDAIGWLAASATGDPTDAKVARRVARAIGDLGATACNRLDGTDEPLGRCMNYATSTLATGVEATTLPLGPALKKEVILAAKLSASIGAVLAHAGRVVAPDGSDPVDHASAASWSAIRADLGSIRAAESALAAAADRVTALRELAPPWRDGTPSWVPRSSGA
jgi:hypothetical protein